MRVVFNIIVLLWVSLTSQAAWSVDKFVPLTAGENAPPLNTYIYYTENYEGPIDFHQIKNNLHKFSKLNSTTIEFGLTDEPILVVFEVRNIDDEFGEWILSLGRKVFHELMVYELNPDSTHLIIDNKDFEQVKSNTWQYMALAKEIVFEPGQSKIFVIDFKPRNTFYLPLSIKTHENYYHHRRNKDLIVFGSFIGIWVLVIANASFFLFTGIRDFIWLSLAEAAYTLQIICSAGYSNYFFAQGDPAYGNFINVIPKCLFTIFLCLFVQNFITTKTSNPTVHIFLWILIILATGTVVGNSLYYLITQDVSILFLKTSWLLTLGIALILPYVAIRATLKQSIDYWPLIPGWSIFCIFVLYGLVHTLDIVQVLPIMPELIGPFGLIEVLFVNLALGLHLRRVQNDSINNQKLLNLSLKEKLAANQEALKVARDRANALALLQDQSSIIHASAHDSKQVISALNSAVFLLEGSNKTKNYTELKDIIQTSASYLKQIVSSTLSGANLTVVGNEFIALSRFCSEELFLSLEMLYKKQARQKGLGLSFDFSVEDYLISDLAILTRSLSNFISNSMKFTDSGHIHILGERRDKNYVITITDTGCGVSEKAIDQLNIALANRFKASEEKEGTGSGYLFSKALMTGLGGTVSIENGITKGAIVTIKLPMVDAHTPCQLDDLRHLLPTYQLNDFGLVNMIKPEGDQDRSRRVAVTYDDSPIARERISQSYQFALYRPLCEEFAHQINIIKD